MSESPLPRRDDSPRAAVVRRATSAEWFAVRAIRLEALADTPDAYGETLDTAQKISDDEWRNNLDNRFYVCAFVDDTAVGLASGGENDNFPGTEWLYGMYVTPTYRGSAVAQQLVEAVVARARQRGADALYLQVTLSVERAVAFYQKLGFVETGECRQMERDATLELALMRLPLESWRVAPVASGELHELRRRVLRGGRVGALVSEPRDDDPSTLNLAGHLGDELIACASFYRSSGLDRAPLSSYQLRFMAVDERHQGRGFGERLLRDGERRLAEGGVQLLWAKARDSALGFYERTGWSALEGSQHRSAETDLPHTVVLKWLAREVSLGGVSDEVK